MSRLSFGNDFYRHYVHVDDAARALVLALDAESATRREYNITGGLYATLGEVAQAVRDVLPTADIVLQSGRDPVDDVQHRFDIRAAERDLGYVPQILIHDGIRTYARWLRDQQSGHTPDLPRATANA